jgi:hypothetical protein
LSSPESRLVPPLPSRPSRANGFARTPPDVRGCGARGDELASLLVAVSDAAVDLMRVDMTRELLVSSAAAAAAALLELLEACSAECTRTGVPSVILSSTSSPSATDPPLVLAIPSELRLLAARVGPSGMVSAVASEHFLVGHTCPARLRSRSNPFPHEHLNRNSYDLHSWRCIQRDPSLLKNSPHPGTHLYLPSLGVSARGVARGVAAATPSLEPTVRLLSLRRIWQVDWWPELFVGD